MPAPASCKLTYEDLAAFPDDGKRHELIDGEHFVTPSPRSVHQLIAGNLYYLLRDHLKTHPVGVVMIAPYDIVLSQCDVVVPDLVFFTRERFGQVVGEKNAQGPPNLAVEVLSPRTRRKDELIKRRLYERVGIEDTGWSTPRSTRYASTGRAAAPTRVPSSSPSTAGTC